jgi:hypothetical protein
MTCVPRAAGDAAHKILGANVATHEKQDFHLTLPCRKRAMACGMDWAAWLNNILIKSI